MWRHHHHHYHRNIHGSSHFQSALEISKSNFYAQPQSIDVRAKTVSTSPPTLCDILVYGCCCCCLLSNQIMHAFRCRCDCDILAVALFIAHTHAQSVRATVNKSTSAKMIVDKAHNLRCDNLFVVRLHLSSCANTIIHLNNKKTHTFYLFSIHRVIDTFQLVRASEKKNYMAHIFIFIITTIIPPNWCALSNNSPIFNLNRRIMCVWRLRDAKLIWHNNFFCFHYDFVHVYVFFIIISYIYLKSAR